MSTDEQTVNLFDTKEICGHLVPNKVQLVNKDHKFNFGSSDIYKVNIMDNYKAEALICKGGSQCASQTIKGKWTSIYDQAFNIELDNGVRLLANYRYNIKPEITKDPYKTAISQGI